MKPADQQDIFAIPYTHHEFTTLRRYQKADEETKKGMLQREWIRKLVERQQACNDQIKKDCE